MRRQDLHPLRHEVDEDPVASGTASRMTASEFSMPGANGRFHFPRPAAMGTDATATSSDSSPKSGQ
jgi:hypothetical protein